MKIFNWMQKKFNHGSLKDDFAKDVTTRSQFVKTEANEKAFDVLEGWKYGILTIGTLGFDPVLDFSTKQKGYFILESETEEKQEEVHENSVSDTDDVDDHPIVLSDDSSEDEDNEGEVNPLIFSQSGAKKPALLVLEEAGDGEVVETKPDRVAEICEERKAKGERVTLAELFRAETTDTGNKKETACGVGQPAEKKPAALRSKNGLSFAKKLIPHNPEKVLPIKNLNKLMRKMLKRKIHPELEGNYSKMSNDAQNKPGKVEADRYDMETITGDSMFLIPSTSHGF